MKGLLAIFLSFGCLMLVTLMFVATSQDLVVDTPPLESVDSGFVVGS